MANISDLKKLSERLKADYKVYINGVNNASAFLVKSSGLGNDMLKGYDKLNQYISEVSKSLKELGIDPSTYPDIQDAKDTYVSGYNGVSNSQKEITNFLK